MDSLSRNEAIKGYIQALFAGEDENFAFARENCITAGYPNIQVPSHVGKLLYLLTKMRPTKKALEIGTFGGYSALWIAKGLLQGGKLISLEIEPKLASMAREHAITAGYQDKIEIRCGDAKGLLESMIKKNEGPFDLIFIDADKENYSAYLDLAIALSAPGTVLLTDNLIPKGEEIANPAKTNKTACAIYEFNKKLANDPRLESVLSTTIARKEGRIDALGISIVKSI